MSDEMHTSDDVTVVLVHGAFADASSWSGVIERLQRGASGHGPCEPAPRHRDRLRLHRRPCSSRRRGRCVAVGHSYGGAVITNAAAEADNVVGLVYVAAFAPDEGERLGEVEAGSKDSVLNDALVPHQYPVAGGGTATEFSIDPAQDAQRVRGRSLRRAGHLIAAIQRPIAEAGFPEPNGPPAWKKLPSWAVVATGDKAAGADVVRSMAERAGAKITEVEGSHVIMISQPDVVSEVILEAVAAVHAPVGG